jgi:hypothetical protein
MGSLWNRSGMVERYGDDLAAVGAQAFFYSGGTTTPLTVFRDSAEASAFPNPVLADGHGRWPDVFVPYIASFDVQVKNAEGTQLTFTSMIPNPDPVNLSVTVDPSNTVQTGMIHAELVNTTKPGYVRLNGLTIGNASSGATERANADTSALFAYLWNNVSDTFATVSSGRGTSAASDFAANSTIVLPSMQGSVFIGLDDMGNLPVGSFGTLVFGGGDGVTPGSFLGSNSKALTIANMPAHTHTGSTSFDGDHVHSGGGSGSDITDTENAGHTHNQQGSFTTSTESVPHTHQYGGPTVGVASGAGNAIFSGATQTTSAESTTHTHGVTLSGVTGAENQGHAHAFNYSFITSTDGGHSHTFTTDARGQGQAFNNMPLSRLVTWFIKL